MVFLNFTRTPSGNISVVVRCRTSFSSFPSIQWDSKRHDWQESFVLRVRELEGGIISLALGPSNMHRETHTLATQEVNVTPGGSCWAKKSFPPSFYLSSLPPSYIIEKATQPVTLGGHSRCPAAAETEGWWGNGEGCNQKEMLKDTSSVSSCISSPSSF